MKLFFPVVALHEDILEGMCVGVWRILLIISRVADTSTTVKDFSKSNPKKDCQKKD